MSWLTRLIHKNGAEQTQEAPPDSGGQGSDSDALIRAVAGADVAAAEKCLAAGSDANARTEGGEPLLAVASSNGQQAIVELLLSAGADPDSATEWGTPLMYAAQAGHAPIVRALLAAGADVNAPAPMNGRTPLDGAEATGNFEIARLLREAGATATVPAEDHLEHAAWAGSLERVRHHLQHAAGPDAGKLGLALLRVAGVDPDSRADSLEIARMLVSAGADIDFQDEQGTSPLMMAVACRNAEVVGLLVEQGADPALPGQMGETALSLAFASDDEESRQIARELAGARPRRSAARTLTTAVECGAVELVRTAIEAGVDVNSRNANGIPALLLAVHRDDGPVTEMLLAAGADPDLTDEDGLTAMEAAVLGQRFEALRRLVAATTVGHAGEGEHGTVPFGDGTHILRFPDGFDEAYALHIQFIEWMKAEGTYPMLRVYGLRAARPEATCARLIVATGAREAAQRLAETFYSPRAERFVADRCAGDWTAINPASSVSNVADPGMSVDLESFDRLVSEVSSGTFVVEQTLY